MNEGQQRILAIGSPGTLNAFREGLPQNCKDDLCVPACRLIRHRRFMFMTDELERPWAENEIETGTRRYGLRFDSARKTIVETGT
ncbi:MAG: hypothetical protein OXD40_13030 [bacterium]|nr:hypothetical protein [bacterium]